MSTGLCHDLRAAVAAGRLDLALVLEPATEPAVGPDGAAAHGAAQGVATRGVATAVLGPARLTLVAAPAHAALLAAEHPPTPAVLTRAVLYASDPRGAYHAVLAAYFAGHGVAPPHLRSVGSVDAVKRRVLGVDAPGVRDPGPDGPVLGVLSARDRAVSIGPYARCETRHLDTDSQFQGGLSADARAGGPPRV